ncbi:hypothetical protein DKM44_13845 [Deinococcus irradiatisoli]|uniref:Uncharacterized protein n=1 Tax=Deinococcus irradiatisoli TaxID=2202254 RepID=A0A2Z3JG54_9DEIO|nr:hypothetical protein [Deinococcus irradiatisoli]AWN24177.1 hypothetical protein DKM44_13845 [Deinococcus irradiatisoli]
MPKIIDLRFRWIAGTMNQLRFVYAGRTYTMRLTDLQWMHGRFSCDRLYLSGSVSLAFSAGQIDHLLAYLAQPSELQAGLAQWSPPLP